MDYESIKRLGLDHYNFDLSKSYEVYDSTHNNHIIHLYLLKDININCPICSSKEIRIKSTKTSKIKYSTNCENNIIIELHRRIYICSNCNRSFIQKSPIASEGKNISIQKDLKILQALRDKTKTYSAIAKEYDVSPTYVINLFDQKVDLKRQKLPQVLCIDEVYSKRLTKTSYCCVLYSPQRKKVIDVLDSRRQDSLIDYFARIPIEEKSNVRFISMDMWETYRRMAKLCLPKALICVDSFHVIKQLNQCFGKIRIAVMNKYQHLKYENSNYYWLFKKYHRFLLTDLSKLPDTPIKVNHSNMYLYKRQIIKYMLELSPELSLAYELKEEYRTFNSVATVDNAKEWLSEIILKFKESNLREYISFWRLLQNWQEEILNSFNRVNGYRISNGPMERLNRDIKTIYGLSFGSTNFTRVRNRIIYCLNEDAPILGCRKKETNKRVGKERGKYKV